MPQRPGAVADPLDELLRQIDQTIGAAPASARAPTFDDILGEIDRTIGPESLPTIGQRPFPKGGNAGGVLTGVATVQGQGQDRNLPMERPGASIPVTPPGPRGRDVNLPMVAPPEVTALSPQEEARFQQWTRARGITDVDHPDSRYDYRGFWKASGDVPIRFGVDHFPDTYKQHGHPTFSVESRYSRGPHDGGRWEGETFVPSTGPSLDEVVKTKKPGEPSLNVGPASVLDQIGYRPRPLNPEPTFQMSRTPEEALDVMDANLAMPASRPERPAGLPVIPKPNAGVLGNVLATASPSGVVDLGRKAATGLFAGAVAAPVEAMAAIEALAHRSPTSLRNLEVARQGSAMMAPPEDIAGDVFSDPVATLGNPSWWAYQGGQAVGSILSLVAAGAPGTATGAEVALLARVGPKVAQRMIAVGGASTAAVAESWLEGSLAFSEAIQRGQTPDEAAAIAAKVFAANTALLGVTNLPLFNQALKSTIGTHFVRAVSEGSQEAGQEAIGMTAQGQPLDPGRIATASIVGGMAGAGFSTVHGRVSRPPLEPPGPRVAGTESAVPGSSPGAGVLPVTARAPEPLPLDALVQQIDATIGPEPVDESGRALGGYAGPEQRGSQRVSTPTQDEKYQRMREQIARGEPTGTEESRQDFAQRQRVEEIRRQGAVDEISAQDRPDIIAQIDEALKPDAASGRMPPIVTPKRGPGDISTPLNPPQPEGGAKDNSAKIPLRFSATKLKESEPSTVRLEDRADKSLPATVVHVRFASNDSPPGTDPFTIGLTEPLESGRNIYDISKPGERQRTNLEDTAWVVRPNPHGKLTPWFDVYDPDGEFVDIVAQAGVNTPSEAVEHLLRPWVRTFPEAPTPINPDLVYKPEFYTPAKGSPFGTPVRAIPSGRENGPWRVFDEKGQFFGDFYGLNQRAVIDYAKAAGPTFPAEEALKKTPRPNPSGSPQQGEPSPLDEVRQMEPQPADAIVKQIDEAIGPEDAKPDREVSSTQPVAGKDVATAPQAPAAVPFPVATAGSATQAGEHYTMAPQDITVDAARFQFKAGANAQGVTSQAKIEGPWNEARAGTLMVWKDPANGQTYVVNGHHRLAAALAKGASRVAVRYLEAGDASEARIEGALTNIAEDKGTPIDAATLMREAPKKFADAHLPKHSALVRDATGLAHLSDPLFARVVSGDISEQTGGAIGSSGLTPEGQAAVVKLVDRQQTKGRTLTPAQVRMLAEDVASTPEVATGGDGQTDIFGVLGDERTASVAVEKAVLRGWVGAALAKDKRLFGFVSKAGRAEALAKGGNIIDEAASKAIAAEAGTIGAVFDRLARSKGPVSAALNAAAARIAAGEPVHAVRSDLLEAVKAAVATELRRPPSSPPAADTGAGSADLREREPTHQERRAPDQATAVVAAPSVPDARARSAQFDTDLADLKDEPLFSERKSALPVTPREAQPALPGAEAVRETEIKTPEFDAPFSLTPKTRKPYKNTGFGLPPHRDDLDRLLFSTRAEQTDSPAFKKWFGKGTPRANATKDGQPKVLYHGTTKDFTRFKPSTGGAAGPGIYLSKAPELSGLFADRSGGRVLPVYASGQYLRVPYDELINIHAWNTRARDEGYDGLDTGLGELVVFAPENIKSATGNRGTFDQSNNNILFSRREPSVRPFYSALTRAAEALTQAKGTPEQMLAMLTKGKGVKQDELRWSGIAEWLKEQPGTVVRAAIVDYLRANELHVEEVMHGGGLRVERTSSREWAVLDGDGNVVSRAAREDEARAKAEHGTTATKFSQWQVPGAEPGSYRELLLTLPAKSADPLVYPDPLVDLPEGWDPIYDSHARADRQWAVTPAGQIHGAPWQGYRYATKQEAVKGTIKLLNEQRNESAANAYREAVGAGQFKGGHFEEPNVVAHIRFNDRLGQDGAKVLFVEEVQSDWHQKGRKQGYRLTNPTKDDAKRFFDIEDVVWRGMSEDMKQGYVNEMKSGEKHVTEGTVHDAPFKTTWPALAMRRAIRYAAEHGYDRIAWTTGAIQNARYDLSTKVESVRWGPIAAGTPAFVEGARTFVNIDPIDSNMIRISLDADGTSIVGSGGNTTEFVGKHITDIIGKDVAERITSQPKGDLIGEGLKVGGAGMEGFYDKILPAAMNKFGKPFGAKVGETYLESAKKGLANDDAAKGAAIGATPVHALDLTPAMRATALEGLPLFARENRELIRLGGNVPADLRAFAQSHQDMVRRTYDEAPTVPVKGREDVAFLDAGSRLTTAERDRLMADPAVQRVVKVTLDVLDDVLTQVLSDRAGLIERTGVLLDDNTFGVFLPNTRRGDARRAMILINPLEIMIGRAPQEAAKLTYETAVHESLHWDHPFDGPEFEEAVQAQIEGLGQPFQQDAVERIMEAYAGLATLAKPGEYDRGLRSVLPLYSESRGRPERAPDAISRARRDAARPSTQSRAERKPARPLRSSRDRTVSTRQLQRLADKLGTSFEAQRARAVEAGYTIEAAHATDVLAEVSGSPTRRAFSEPPQSPTPVTPRPPLVRPSDLTKRISALFAKLPVKTRRFRERAVGIYKAKEQVIRLKVENDLATLAHELGHHIDLAIFGKDLPYGLYKGELLALGKNTSRASDTQQTKLKEGAAEFFRLYVAEPTEARRQAPEYFKAFEAALDGNEWAPAIRETQQIFAEYLAQDLATRGEARIDFTGTDPSRNPFAGFAADPRGWLQARAREWVDDLGDAQRVVDALESERGTPINALESAYVLSRLARGNAGKAQGFLEFGPRSADGTFLSGSLEAALTPVKKDLQAFSHFLVALRVVELRGRGIEAGISLKEAQAILDRHVQPGYMPALLRLKATRAGEKTFMTEAEAEAAVHAQIKEGFGAFDDARAAIYAYQDSLLVYARGLGALSGDQVSAIRALNQFYVPFQRVLDATEQGLTGTSKRIANRGLPVKRIKGSGKDIINPLESIIRNTFAIVDMVEKNRAMLALVDQASAVKGSGKFIERIPDPQIATQFNLSQVSGAIKRALEEAGLDVAEVLPDGGELDLDEMVKVFTPAQFVAQGTNVVSVIRAGTREWYSVNDQPLYDTITAVGPQITGWVRALSGPASWLRAGATLTLGFIARNPARDTFVAGVQSRYGFVPIVDTVRGLFSYLKADEYYQDFLNSGAANSALVSRDRNQIRNALRKMVGRRSVPRNPIELLRALSEATEMATRVGEFRRGVQKEGATPEGKARAALAARDVTMDFARAGSVGRQINQFAAFFNARVQGYARMVELAQGDYKRARSGKDPNPLHYATGRAAVIITLLSALVWAMNRDDEEYEEIPDWEKATYWHIPTPTGGWVRIPKPFEWGTIFGTTTEAALNYLYTKDPAKLRNLFPDGPGPTLRGAALSILPVAIMPWIENMANYDFFRDRTIVSPYDTNLPPELQYSRWTSDTAKTLGTVMGVSPAKIENIVNGYFAGLGRATLQAPSVLTHLTQMSKAPAFTASDIPVVGTFYRPRRFTAQATSLQELYDLSDRLSGATRAAKVYQAQGDTAKINELRQSLGPVLLRKPVVAEGVKALKELRPFIDQTYGSTTITPSQKRERLDRIYEQMVSIARQALGKPPLQQRKTS